MQPFVFFSYGMTKCGSTLAFELARTALVQAGMPQAVLPLPDLIRSQRVNAVDHITEDQAKAVQQAVTQLGHPIVLKTHTRPDPAVVRMIETGTARAHAVIRDLRDMALSMMDHGIKARAEGQPAFAEIETLDNAMAGIDNQLDSLTAWMQLPGIEVLKYDTLAFDTETAAAEILRQLGIEGDPARIAHHVKTHAFTQFNRGIRDRHKAEMSNADSRCFRDRYAPFYDLLLYAPHPRRLPLATNLKITDQP